NGIIFRASKSFVNPLTKYVANRAFLYSSITSTPISHMSFTDDSAAPATPIILFLSFAVYASATDVTPFSSNATHLSKQAHPLRDQISPSNRYSHLSLNDTDASFV